MLSGNTTSGTTKQATLLVHAAAGFGTAGHLTGHVSLSGDSLIAFDSGTISTIDANASLTLDGTQARVATQSLTSRNSALEFLTSILGRFALESDQGLDINNDLAVGSSSAGGALAIGDAAGAGGSYLEVDGSLTSAHASSITVGNSSLAAGTTLLVLNRVVTDAASTISITGGGVGGPLATLNVGSQADPGAGFEAGFGTTGAGHLTGQVTLSGNALLAFQTGQITTIDAGSSLTLNGAQADVGYAAGDGNAALRGLSNVGGTLDLEDGAALATSGDLTASMLSVDGSRTFSGGSRLDVNGKLTVSRLLEVGNHHSRSSTTVTATSLSAGDGSSIQIVGDQTEGSANRASLIVDSTASFGGDGLIHSGVHLSGAASLQFTGGGFEGIAADGSVRLDGADAYVSVAGEPQANSALDQLAANGGLLQLTNGASVRTSGTGLTNYYELYVDYSTLDDRGDGGSSLSIGGELTNSGSVFIGHDGLYDDANIDATSLDNSGVIKLAGSSVFNAGGQATLTLAGGGSNTGGLDLFNNARFKVGADFLDSGDLSLSGSTVEVGGGTFDVAAAVSGQGRFLIDGGATLKLRSAAGDFAGSLLQFNGSNAGLSLGSSTTSAHIGGFAGTDTIDLVGYLTKIFSYTGRILTVENDGSYFQYSVSGTATGAAAKTDGAGGTTVTGISDTYALTTGTDLVTLLRGTHTITATAATLNATDNLSGGTGTDTLALSGGGTFALGGLAGFTGFEQVTAAAGANYTLGTGDATVAASQTLTVDASAVGASNKLVFDGSAEEDGSFSVIGGAGADTITTGAGADSIDGRGGADTMAGGSGDDTYYVDNIRDKVIEASGGGGDIVHSTVTFSLAGQYAEELDLDGTASINGTGNGLDNAITGNAGKNVINGGRGADTMAGGSGNDTYYVDDIGDKVIETNVTGYDTVHSTVSFSLSGGYAERLYLDGTTAIDGTGNSLANVIAGNGVANVINGGKGDDKLTGGGGADTFIYHAGWGRDTITDFAAGAAGTDKVQVDKTLFKNYSDLMAHTIDSSAGAVVSTDAANTITFTDVTKAQFASSNFVFV